MRRHLSAADIAGAVGMLQSGLIQRQVFLQLHVSQSVICRTWNQFNRLEMCLKDEDLNGIAVQQPDRSVIGETWRENSGFRAL